MDHIKIVPSTKFLKVIVELNSKFDAPDLIKQYVNKDTLDQQLYLTTSDIKWCQSKIKVLGVSLHLYDLISESEVILPKYEVPARNEELQDRIVHLKLREQEKEYKRMTQNINLSSFVPEVTQMKREIQEINRQLITGLQYIVSVIGTFFGVFVGVGFMTVDYGPRALLAVLCSVAVGIAEIYFIIRDDIRKEALIKRQ